MLEAVDRLVDGGVVDVAVIAVVETGDARPDSVAQRQVEYGTTAEFALGEEAGLDIAAQVAGRFFRDDIDHAGRRVLAEQRALRPAQHFELIDVDQIAERLTRTGEDDTIDHGRDRRLAGDREGRGAHAAQEQRLVERRTGFQEVQRGDEILRALQADLALRRQRIARNDRHGDRHILQSLAAFLRGDDDLAGRGILCCRGSVGGRRRWRDLRECRGSDQREQGRAGQIKCFHSSLH